MTNTLPDTLQIIPGQGGNWVFVPFDLPDPEPEPVFPTPLPVIIAPEPPAPVASRTTPTAAQLASLSRSIFEWLVGAYPTPEAWQQRKPA